MITTFFQGLALRFLTRVERKAAYLRGKGYGRRSLIQETRLALSLLKRPPRLIVDVGANVGEYSLILRQRYPDTEIHIFEPSAHCASQLFAKFGDDPKTYLHRQALSDTEGEAILFSDHPSSGLASLLNRDLRHVGKTLDITEVVQTIRFASFWENHLDSRWIDIAKIDVEGFELSVLNGFGDAILNTSVIQFETGGTNIDARTYLKDFFIFFENKGFLIHRIGPLGLEKISRYEEMEESFTTTNFLAVNKSLAC